MKYIESIRKSVEENLKDGSLIVMGQDIRAWGGAGTLFKGLFEKFPDKVIDTPISESATANIAIGSAMSGVRVIVEYSFMDFILHSADQIINQAAKIDFMSNGEFQAPVVFRAVVNSARGYGATHSQSLENIFFKVPGLQVVYPSNSTDGYDLMNMALSSDMPTLFIEHKLLHEKSDAFSAESLAGTAARIIRKGDKATVVSYGKAVIDTFEVLEENGISDIELIDLRFLNPLDIESVSKSVQKSGRLLVIDECYGAVGAEIIAQLSETLDNPFMAKRLTTAFEQIPVNEDKEKAVLVTKEKILESVKELLKDASIQD